MLCALTPILKPGYNHTASGTRREQEAGFGNREDSKAFGILEYLSRNDLRRLLDDIRRKTRRSTHSIEAIVSPIDKRLDCICLSCLQARTKIAASCTNRFWQPLCIPLGEAEAMEN